MKVNGMRHDASRVLRAYKPESKEPGREKQVPEPLIDEEPRDTVSFRKTHGRYQPYNPHDRHVQNESKNDEAIPGDTVPAEGIEDNPESISGLPESKSEADSSGGRVESSASAGGISAKAPSPTDNSGALTRKLVDAQEQFEVQMVLSEVFKSIGSLRLTIAAGSSEDAQKAQAILKKLNKLVVRGRRKLKDLGKESELQRKQIKAEKDQKEQRAREIKSELRKRKLEREQRERGYLREASQDAVKVSVSGMTPNAAKLDSATEAQLQAQAEAMAAAEVSVSADSAVSGDVGAAAGASATTDGASAEVSGGSSDAGAVAEGGVDVVA